MPSTLLHPEVQIQKDFLPLTGIDYLEFYVGNACQAAYYYRAAFGMTLVAWAGPETGLPDRSSYVLEQGEVRFVLTAPLRPDGGIAAHIHRHGDGVRDIALGVTDVKLAWRETTRRGARSVHECHRMEDHFGQVKLASIAAYGDTLHTFVDRGHYHGPFLPGYEPVDHDPVARPVGVTAIDHVAANVGWNEMRRWLDYYTDILGFNLQGRDLANEISEVDSPIRSRVVSSGAARISFPINEPAEARERSQVEQYLESYHGPGVQRVALATHDILATVGKMRQQGVEFLRVPRSYYMNLNLPPGAIAEPIADLASLDILVERNDSGYLLQAFTRPVEDRSTLFFEIVQRNGHAGFGEGNTKALAEAIEQETRAFRNR